MFHDMAEEHGVEHPAFADDPRRLLLGQIAGVDVVALLAGDLGRDGVGLDADDLGVSGAAQALHEAAVIAADIDGLAGILAGDRCGDQVVEVPRPLKARRVGVGLGIDQVGGNGVHDL